MKKKKKKKLDSIPKINRKLFKLWSEAVRERAGYKCEVCGTTIEELRLNKSKLDAHHLISRNIKNSPLKFHTLNGICLCPVCHKFGERAFHRNPVFTITWLQNNIPIRYHFVLENSETKIDLQNRKVLAEIKERLEAKEGLDLEKLSQIEKDFPRQSRKAEVIPDDIFENIVDEEELDSMIG